ncbi:DUF445 domain-containing protein [Desulfurivibrio sp. C05AmB]|uniref:DUF445 domain-containing protein n=1 Tax=Desulfurivibrio sp. C05AmB TaxID=3374371 RepID=UPI00376F2A2D
MNSLAYLSLPLIGALIGYLTNHIAIRMLFRPLKPWRIAGVRIPLTPGVIPAARHRRHRPAGRGPRRSPGPDFGRGSDGIPGTRGRHRSPPVHQ